MKGLLLSRTLCIRCSRSWAPFHPDKIVSRELQSHTKHPPRINTSQLLCESYTLPVTPNTISRPKKHQLWSRLSIWQSFVSRCSFLFLAADPPAAHFTALDSPALVRLIRAALTERPDLNLGGSETEKGPKVQRDSLWASGADGSCLLGRQPRTLRATVEQPGCTRPIREQPGATHTVLPGWVCMCLGGGERLTGSWQTGSFSEESYRECLSSACVKCIKWRP